MLNLLAKFVLLCLLPLSLFADRDGPSISLGGGYTQFNQNENFVNIINDYSTGGKLALGAYINENLSVELEFNYLGEFDTGFSLNTLSVINVAVLAHLPLFDDTLDLTGKFGAGDLRWQETTQFQNQDSTSALVSGIGVAYRFTYAWSLKVGADIYYFSYRKSPEDSNIDLEVASYYTTVEYQFETR